MAPPRSKSKKSGVDEPVALSKAAPSSDGSTLRPSPPPLAPPPFDVKHVRAAIPEHCFERSAVKSFIHLFRDFAIAAVFFYGATFISQAPEWARYILWPIYWYAQGAILTGVWVMAHECGHQAFSDSKFLNDTVGWVCHSFLLVPYHSWRITHAAHHKNTCSMENDEVFVPSTRSMFKEMIADTPLANALGVFTMFTVGWPGYLLANFSGPSKYSDKSNSHFNPWAALFSVKQRWDVFVSDIGFFMMVAALAYAGQVFGSLNVIFYYVVPYLVVNMHLVLITFLQHTDTYIPHYREAQFTWLRGALSTVDRSFGWVLDSAFHHIADTHVAHHLFHEMPFYHAQEATAALKKFLGPYYLYDATPIPQAVWNSWKTCKFVEDEGDILFFKGAADWNDAKKA